MRVLARSLLLIFALLPFACSAAENAQYQEGKAYKRVREQQKPVDPKRVSVEEFFWYGCPHCYAVDPLVKNWARGKAADVDFARVPSTLGRPEGVLHAKAYYAAESLNVLDQVHPAMFDAIHQRHQHLNTEQEIAAVFNRASGIMPDVAISTMKGFAVDARARRGEQLAKSYGVVSVPVFVVGGKYMTSATMAGSNEQALKVVDHLIAKVRQERAK